METEQRDWTLINKILEGKDRESYLIQPQQFDNKDDWEKVEFLYGTISSYPPGGFTPTEVAAMLREYFKREHPEMSEKATDNLILTFRHINR